MSLDLPPPPPPPAPRPALGRGATIALGCGVAAGAAAFLALAGFILAVVVLPARTVPKGRIFVDSIFAKAEGNKNLTKDDLAVYKEIADLVASPESSVFAVNVGGAILYDHLKDGALSSEEIAAATAVRGDVEKDLQGGAFALATYVKAHPEMQESITEFTRAMALSRVRVP